VFAIYAAGMSGITPAQAAAAVWDEPRASHSTAGTFGQGVTSVQGSVTGSVGSVGTGGITSGTFAANAIDAAAITAAAINKVADGILDRDMATGTDSGGRTVRNAFRFLRNKHSVVGTTLTVFKEDDLTTAWTATVTTDGSAVAITGVDPA
jgi:hypothetical protein